MTLVEEREEAEVGRGRGRRKVLGDISCLMQAVGKAMCGAVWLGAGVCVWLPWWGAVRVCVGKVSSRAGWGVLASLHSSRGGKRLKQPSEMGDLARKIEVQRAWLFDLKAYLLQSQLSQGNILIYLVLFFFVCRVHACNFLIIKI